MIPRGRPKACQTTARALDYFDKFCGAETLESILKLHGNLCETLNISPDVFPKFFPKLLSTLKSSDAQDLLTKYDKRANSRPYEKGNACKGLKVLVIGAGPCGLRTAIEAQLLGCKVIVVEKRTGFSRNNVLHLWPFVITDLKNLGAKKFYGKFCPGAIDHISIAKLQLLLLKVALLLGVEIHFDVGFEDLVEPNSEGGAGWRVKLTPDEHPVAAQEFDAVIGADGKRNTLKGFPRKVLRGKLAIAITANFVNQRSAAEAKVQEISGVSFIYKQDFFNEFCQTTGIDLENIVYYKDETHYFVMTAKKHSLLWKGVLHQDFAETDQLLAPSNVNRNALFDYIKEAVNYCTYNQLPDLQFAKTYRGEPDVAIIDFTAMHTAENASRIIERHGHKILLGLVGDSLLEPFWPTGSGCARGFLSAFDACWMLKSWAKNRDYPLEVIAERESIYRNLAQTTPENLSKDHNSYNVDPLTRYPHINCRFVKPAQVVNMFDSDVTQPYQNLPQPQPVPMKPTASRLQIQEHQQKENNALRRSRTFCSAASRASRTQNRMSAIQTIADDSEDELPDLDALIGWFKEQVIPYNIQVDGIQDIFVKGDVLCAVINRFRPDLLPDFPLPPEVQQGNDEDEQAGFRNQLAFDFIRGEYFIPCKVTGIESIQHFSPNLNFLISYAVKIYETFKYQKPRGIVKPRVSELNCSTKLDSSSILKNDEETFYTPTGSPVGETDNGPSYVSSVWTSTTNYFDPEEQEPERRGRKVQRSSSIQRMVQRLNQNQQPSAKSSPFGHYNPPVSTQPPAEVYANPYRTICNEMKNTRVQEAENTKVHALKMVHALQCRKQDARHEEQAAARERFIRTVRAQKSEDPEPQAAQKKAKEEDDFFNEYNMRLWRASRPTLNERTQNLEQKLLNTGLERRPSLRDEPVKNQLFVPRGLQRSATESVMKSAPLPNSVNKFRKDNSTLKLIEQKLQGGQEVSMPGKCITQDDEDSSSFSSKSPSPEKSPKPTRAKTEDQVISAKFQVQVTLQPQIPTVMSRKLNTKQFLGNEKKQVPQKPSVMPGKLSEHQFKPIEKKDPPKVMLLPGKLSSKTVPKIQTPQPKPIVEKSKIQIPVTNTIKQIVAKTDGVKKSFSTTHMYKHSAPTKSPSSTNISSLSSGKKNDFSEYFVAKAAAEAKAAQRQVKRDEQRAAREARMQGQSLSREVSPGPAQQVAEARTTNVPLSGQKTYALTGSKSFHQITSSTPTSNRHLAPKKVSPQTSPKRSPQPYRRQTTLEEFDALLDLTEDDDKILEDLDEEEIDHLLDWTSKNIEVGHGVETV